MANKPSFIGFLCIGPLDCFLTIFELPQHGKMDCPITGQSIFVVNYLIQAFH